MSFSEQGDYVIDSNYLCWDIKVQFLHVRLLAILRAWKSNFLDSILIKRIVKCSVRQRPPGQLMKHLKYLDN